MANIKSTLILFVLAIAAAGWFAIEHANNKADALTIKLDKLQQQYADKETEVINLADEVHAAELEKQHLLNERQRLTEIQIKREQKLKLIESEYQTALQLISELKANENETISNWASVPIPFDVSRMLRYAETRTDNKNSNSNQSGAGDATSRVINRLHSSSNF